MLARCSFFCVWVDAHIDPREVANSLEISVKSGYFAGTMWASSHTNLPGDYREGSFLLLAKKFFGSCNQCTELSSFEAEGQMKKEESL